MKLVALFAFTTVSLGLAAAGRGQEVWIPTSTVNTPAARLDHKAVWTGTRMIVWGGWSGGPALDTGGLYDPATNTWAPTATSGAPASRRFHTAVWTGSRMVVWGGLDDGFNRLNTGGVYDPVTNSWTPTSTAGAPTGRWLHTAVWTGSRMIVCGGAENPANPVPVSITGGSYDPVTDTWSPLTTVGAPVNRYGHAAVWTGARMIVWGGASLGAPHLNSGGIYDPSSDTWTATTTNGAPSGRYLATAVWTGSNMIVWGGNDDDNVPLNTGGRYDPQANAWTPTSSVGVGARVFHTAVWTGSRRMMVWGGWNDTTSLQTGLLYDPRTDTWTPTATTGAPQARSYATAVSTGTRVVVWAGAVLESPGITSFLDSGGIYEPSATPSNGGYYTVAPCRVVDTRTADRPALAAGATRSFAMTGKCGISPTATAVAANVTVTGADGAGHLTLYPGAGTLPATSSLNFAAGQTRANNAIVLLGGAGDVSIHSGQASGSVHLIVDVTGYFE